MNDGLKEYREKVKSGEIKQKKRGKKKTWTQKANENPTSWKYKCYAKCEDCCLGDVTEIKYCQATICPLWETRPYKK